MGNRLSKITTRTGDDGSTGLGDGSRTDKDGARIQAIGDVDELNSQLGLLLCENLDIGLREALVSIQHDLFDLGGELCIPGYALLTEAKVERLDRWLEKYNAALPPLKDFILPGGNRAAALAHVCRTVCRRAERSIVSLGRDEMVSQSLRQYVNRLSDLLFVLSRVLNRADGGSDVLWQQGDASEQ
ncbi:cob(I)yrinic acid a,c-diamide adenosyltransferase [Collimonas sp.]|jgi:cob(I)alamin adenosyltransferase|uniref:cob(I)yrinic acid a,c-diamide adenosyltransferase n=1 Tax=Collimonas sp. TaxID=1963772 RepID=UPI0037C0F303